MLMHQCGVDATSPIFKQTNKLLHTTPHIRIKAEKEKAPPTKLYWYNELTRAVAAAAWAQCRKSSAHGTCCTAKDIIDTGI